MCNHLFSKSKPVVWKFNPPKSKPVVRKFRTKIVTTGYEIINSFFLGLII